MKKPPTPRLVTVAIFTTITVVLWVFFSVYQILVSTPDVSVPGEILQTVDPTLDTATLEKLPSRLFIEEGQEQPFPLAED